jgi:hypothetical protein
VERRVAGLVLLLLALIAAIAVPVLVGKPIAGVPVAAAIDEPPAVGSCVGEISYPDPAAAGRSGSRQLPVATVVKCAGDVSGEIISVTPRRRSPAVSTLGEYDQANPSCRDQVEKYLGTTATTVIGGVEWNLNIDVDVTTVGPSAHDLAAGRTWSACVLSASNQIYPATPLRGSWSTGTLPDAFGLCWAENLVQRGVPTNCTSPHRTQQIGYGFVAETSDSGTGIVSSATPDEIVAGCRSLAATVMKVADPTRGGALAVRVVDDASGAPYVQCAVAVVGDRKLTGSLIGIGNRPLPLA